jgi:hypothetical protein
VPTVDVQHRDPAASNPPAVVLARWAEARLQDTAGMCTPGARVYGLELIDVAVLGDPLGCGARLIFVGGDGDATSLVLGRAGFEACQHDAAVLTLSCWAWPPDVGPLRPGVRPGRRRARIVTVVAGSGTGSAVRFEHDPEHVVLARGLAAAGISGIQLAAVWQGLRTESS